MSKTNIKKTLSIKLKRVNAEAEIEFLHSIIEDMSRKLRGRDAELELLYKIIEDIAGEIDIERFATKITEKTRKRLEVKAVFSMLLDEKGRNLDLIASSGVKLRKGIKIPKDGIIKDVLDSSLLFRTGRFTIEGFSFDSSLCVPLIVQKRAIGVIIACCKSSGRDFSDWDIRMFSNIALVGNIIKYAIDLQKVHLQTLNVLVKNIEAKSEYTKKHSENVARYAVRIAKKMKLEEKMVQEIRQAALLHDIGKIGVSDVIINKPCCLCKEERENVNKHPEIGYENIKGLDFIGEEVKNGILYHHIDFNGGGYPSDGNAKSGKNISLSARIIRVADSYEAMTSKRPYHPQKKSKKEAIKDLEDNKDTLYDPDVVESFVKALNL
ncbi:MAG: HD domain-containing phosphohydrolase [bacterium]